MRGRASARAADVGRAALALLALLLPAGAAADEETLLRELEAAIAAARGLEAQPERPAPAPIAPAEPLSVRSCAPTLEALLAEGGGDWITHRALTRADFRAPRESPDMVLAYHLPGSRTEAHVATSIQCVGRVRVEAIGGGRWAAWLEDLEYVALLDRTRSWWRPRSDQNPEWVLRHEQLHFDITELAARRRNAQRERDAAALRGVGRSAVEALAAFERAFLAHMDALAAEWEAQQIQYDRETRHGNDVKRQTEWFVRVQCALHASAAAGEG